MGNVVLFGEPMALFTAREEGDLDGVNIFEKSVAGAEINVCTGLTRLGHKASYITKVGDDSFGRYIKKFIENEGIDSQFIKTDGKNKTGFMLKNIVIQGDPKIEYHRVGSAFSKITIDDLKEVNFKNIDILHITGIPLALSENCREATYFLIDRAKEQNVYVTFDPNLRFQLWENKNLMIEVVNKVASKCDLILPGIDEAFVLTGSRDLEFISNFYFEKGVDTVIVKNGNSGTYAKNKNSNFEIPRFKVKKVVDTVGAGDGFAVGILSGKLEGLSLEDCVVRGNAIGAIQVTYSGDNEGLPTREYLNNFINENYDVEK